MSRFAISLTFIELELSFDLRWFPIPSDCISNKFYLQLYDSSQTCNRPATTTDFHVVPQRNECPKSQTIDPSCWNYTQTMSWDFTNLHLFIPEVLRDADARLAPWWLMLLNNDVILCVWGEKIFLISKCSQSFSHYIINAIKTLRRWFSRKFYSLT